MNSQLLGLYQTPSQTIYESTCLELIKELNQDLLENKPINESFTSINGLDKCVEEINFSTNIEKIYKKYHDPKNKRGGTRTNSMKVYHEFNQHIDISKVGNFDQSIVDAIKIGFNLYEKIGTNFYGMLLMNRGSKTKRIVFNPLHPIIAMELMKEKTSIDIKKKEWTIAFYTFKEKSEKYIKSAYPHLYNNENYIEDIGILLAAIDIPSSYIIEHKNFNVDIVEDQFVLNYDEIKRLKDSGDIVDEENNGGRNYIVPCQIINVGGIAYPYYGTIYSTKGLAWNMSPMQSANINHSQGQSTKNGMNGGSRICTHSGNSKTQIGISALNHCNTTSPLNSDCIEPGSMSYVKQSVISSFEIILGEQINQVERILTYKEFIKENDGATKRQFLNYIKHKMKEQLQNKSKKDVKKNKKIDYLDKSKWTLYDGKKQYKNGDVTVTSKKQDNPKMLINDSWYFLESITVKSWIKEQELKNKKTKNKKKNILKYNPERMTPYKEGSIRMHTDAFGNNIVMVYTKKANGLNQWMKAKISDMPLIDLDNITDTKVNTIIPDQTHTEQPTDHIPMNEDPLAQVPFWEDEII